VVAAVVVVVVVAAVVVVVVDEIVSNGSFLQCFFLSSYCGLHGIGILKVLVVSSNYSW